MNKDTFEFYKNIGVIFTSHTYEDFKLLETNDRREYNNLIDEFGRRISSWRNEQEKGAIEPICNFTEIISVSKEDYQEGEIIPEAEGKPLIIKEWASKAAYRANDLDLLVKETFYTYPSSNIKTVETIVHIKAFYPDKRYNRRYMLELSQRSAPTVKYV